MNQKNYTLSIALILMLTSAAAFAAESKTVSTTNTAQTTTNTSSGPSDAEIAHIVVTADAIDIEAGKLAKGMSKNKEVKAFADDMVRDHTAVNKQAGDLAKKLSLAPKDNATSESLMQGAKENIAKLKTLKGADFDKEYVDHEVAYHVAVLAAIDQTLIPNAKNADLKALITKVRPSIAAHLEHAKHLQSEMNGAHKG